jgi:hypothetical protein
MNSTMTFYGRVFVGDEIVWARGGRYSCLIVGRVDSITDGGNLRITAIRADRSDVKPGEKLLAQSYNCMVVKRP